MRALTGLVLSATVVAVSGISQTTPITLVEPGVISTPGGYESFGSLAPNGREFYFTQHQADFSKHRIMVSRLERGTWSVPQLVSISGTWNDREPKLSPDGNRLYFSSNRPMSPDGAAPQRLDLWMTERGANDAWGVARRLEGPVNSDVADFCPVVVANGTLYFISARPGGIRGPEANDVHNVWRARPLDRSGLRFGESENLGAAINTGFETNVFVTPNEQLMLISRDGAPDSLGGDDLYVSRVVGGAWQRMRHLDAPINSDKYEYGPSVSPDGHWLFFNSARAGTADIYRVSLSAIDPRAR